MIATEMPKKLEFGNPKHIKLVHDMNMKQYKRVEFDEYIEIRASCPHCHCESDLYDEGRDCLDDIAERSEKPDDLYMADSNTEEFWKCKNCKKLFIF